jgi:hypothetical protein
MRFKTIVILFNVVIVVSFLFIFFVPLILLGPDYFSLFFSRNWIAGALFIVALASVNGYFAANARLFGLLEREDWPALVRFLESQVYRKGRVRAKQVRLLANAYLLTSNTEAARALEGEVRKKRPDLVRRLAVQFGIPYLLAADSEEAEAYFADLAADPRVSGRDWLRWSRAFCQCRRGARQGARAELAELEQTVRDPVLRLLVLYLLGTVSAGDAASRERADRGRLELRTRYPPAAWARVVDRARSNLEVVVLSKVLQEAEAWMRHDEPEGPGDAPAAGRAGG